MTATQKKQTTKVVVRHPFKVTHAGIGYWPGQLAEVPDRVAAQWRKFGFVDLVDPPAEQADDTEQTEPEQTGDEAEPEPEASEGKPSRRRR